MTDQTNQASFEEWALVEVMGHRQYAGRVTEQVIGGASFVRVDVPAVPAIDANHHARPAFTKILGAGSIFCLTPCTEEAARAMAARMRVEACSVVALPPPVDRELIDDPYPYDGPDEGDAFDERPF
ncbi:MAG: hypothetical protein AAGJ46_10135 [Planctomycetota bacterium]